METVGLIVSDFAVLGFFSLLFGIIFAILSALLMKQARSLTKSPVVECAMIFCFGYLAYISAELCHYSGIISLLTSGIMMAHYTWYNLSPQAQNNSAIVF